MCVYVYGSSHNPVFGAASLTITWCLADPVCRLGLVCQFMELDRAEQITKPGLLDWRTCAGVESTALSLTSRSLVFTYLHIPRGFHNLVHHVDKTLWGNVCPFCLIAWTHCGARG